jgi:hypothetical protein
MNDEQRINNLRRQAAEAMKIGNFGMMQEFDKKATAAKANRHETLFLQMKHEVAKAAPKTPSVPAAVINNQPARRVHRVARAK